MKHFPAEQQTSAAYTHAFTEAQINKTSLVL